MFFKKKVEIEKVDLNDFAKLITSLEGNKKSINIAQVKEIMKIIFTEMSKMSDAQIKYIIDYYKHEIE
jgi:hypothetical protein